MGPVKMIPVVINTNVVISGMLFGGSVGRIVDLWEGRQIQPFLSQEIIDEYIRVLAYPKFSLSEKEIDYILYRKILPYFEIVEPRKRPAVVRDDPSDDIFLYCAVSAHASCIISGDHHLLDLAEFKGIPIFSPEIFFDRYKF